MPFFPDPVGALSGIDPQTMGLLSAASAGLEASGPSRMPVSLGQVFGRALGAGLGGYTQGVQTQQANTLRNLQMRQLQESMAATDQKRKAIQDYAMSLPDAQRTMFLADPEKFLAAQAKAMEPFSLKPGEQRFMNGQPIAAAPESFTLSPGQQRFTGGQAGPSMPANPQLVDVPVPGQPGVTQPTWLRPGEASGTGLGFKVPEILNPDVQNARVGIARAGAPQISVSTEKKYGEQFAGKIADADVSLRDSAIKAPDLADRANRIKQLLSSGKVITGLGADYRLAFGKAASLAGLSAADDPVANTEILATSLAQNTLDSIKTSGLGAGNGFSNADRDFLEKAAGGKITFEKATIDRLATLAHKAATATTQRWNSRVRQIPKDVIQATGIDASPIEVPSLYNSMQPNPIKGNGPKFLGFE